MTLYEIGQDGDLVVTTISSGGNFIRQIGGELVLQDLRLVYVMNFSQEGQK